MRKAQATVRELGLASVMLLLLAAYLYINGLNTSPGPSFNEKCLLPANFSCTSLILKTNGKLDFVLAQNTGGLINVTSFVCTKYPTFPTLPALNNSILITSSEKAYVSGGNSGNEVPCSGLDGVSIPNASAGDIYDANLYIMYKLKNGEPRYITGTILVKYS
ncbi:MAG: hypothetical protein NT130_03300 [Candidatus Micrarchaeota archaeon]|nr:hypothetical protein [Candidatus Micrarchaeota archaeon]